jgi:hypothetical protein
VTLPNLVPVIVMEQEPNERVQVAGEVKVTLPVPELCENITVPVGDDPPLTVAVHDEVEPAANDTGKHETEVVVTAS